MMTVFEAVMTVEEGTASEEAYIEAVQMLIDTGAAWSLQGWYGRLAIDLIEAGVCNPPIAITSH